MFVYSDQIGCARQTMSLVFCSKVTNCVGRLTGDYSCTDQRGAWQIVSIIFL
uniref:Uncharacterized protein n=1 Tax=Oryza brachyantha TaxID=4533 RepID=J3LWQ5_ORYBR